VLQGTRSACFFMREAYHDLCSREHKNADVSIPFAVLEIGWPACYKRAGGEAQETIRCPEGSARNGAGALEEAHSRKKIRNSPQGCSGAMGEEEFFAVVVRSV